MKLGVDFNQSIGELLSDFCRNICMESDDEGDSEDEGEKDDAGDHDDKYLDKDEDDDEADVEAVPE
eukprot:7376956-Prymnesium_polylepis.1